MNHLFPIYVKMEQIQTLLVGAGPVALEKLQAICQNSPEARVRIIAERILPEVQLFIEKRPKILFVKKSFDETDLKDVDLIIVASNNPSLNENIRFLAHKHHLLLNIADTPRFCDFYLGSVVQKGNLKIGISTNGKSPTIAKRLKEFLNDLLPEEIDETLELMQQLRNQLTGDFQERVRILNAHTQELIDNNRI